MSEDIKISEEKAANEKLMNMSACDFVEETRQPIKTDKCGVLNVFIQVNVLTQACFNPVSSSSRQVNLSPVEDLSLSYYYKKWCTKVQKRKIGQHASPTEEDDIGLKHVWGNIADIKDRTPVFLTVHDIGCNHAEFHNFVEHPSMEKIKERSVFLHVELPGQEYDAPTLDEDFHFPSMQEVAEDLIYILDFYNIKYVITVGEGAGANILARFAMLYPNRVLGNVLLHCTSTVAGIMEYFNDKIINWKLETVGMNPTAEQYLVFHKFGAILEQQIENAEDKDKVINEYIKKLKSRINPRNLRLYVDSFLNRTDISGVLKDKMKVDTLLVTGAKASHVHTVHTMHTHMDPKWTTLLKIDDVGDVMNEVPHRLAHNILLFCQGLGLLSALTISRQSSLLTA